jgi:hypothetical protein
VLGQLVRVHPHRTVRGILRLTVAGGADRKFRESPEAALSGAWQARWPGGLRARVPGTLEVPVPGRKAEPVMVLP